MTLRAMASGGRESARRFVILIGIGLCALPSPTNATAQVPSPPPQVLVHEDHGVYRVTAQFTVTQPPSLALAVLTDYEDIPRFMPDVKKSTVRERSGGRVVVEQEAVSSVLMFSKRIHLRLEVQEGADTLHFRDASGRSFTTYEGTWHVAAHDGPTVVTYELRARPAFGVPEFLLTRLLKKDAKHMIERLQAEIAARQSAGPSVSTSLPTVGRSTRTPTSVQARRPDPR